MLLQQLVNGLTLGAVYTLVALAFSLVMGILGVLNLAVGELFMLGGYIGFAAIAGQLPLPIALIAGMLGAVAVSILIQKVAYEPLRDAPLVTPMLSTLGFSIVLQNVVVNLWGSDPLQLPPELFDTRYSVGPVSIGLMQIVIIAVTILLVIAVAFVVQKTPAGRALRAVAKTATSRGCWEFRSGARRCLHLQSPVRSRARPAFSSDCIIRRSRHTWGSTPG
jgi:branched-chain amino acid transport system permease protein